VFVAVQFLATTDGTLKIFVLPAYSPQLNPDEWVWKNAKHDRIGRASVTNADDLKAKAVGALRRLQNMPHLVRAFFADRRSCCSGWLDEFLFSRAPLGRSARDGRL
jgi:hypothetical protein